MVATTIKRTNINLDRGLVEAAAAVLGTAQTTATVHAALRDVVDRAARQRLAGRDFADLTPTVLKELRDTRKLGWWNLPIQAHGFGLYDQHLRERRTHE